MKKTIIAVVIALVACIGLLAGCSVPGDKAVTASQEKWNAATNKEATDTFTVSNVNIAGLATLKNAKISLKRVFAGDNVKVTLDVDSLDLAFDKGISSILNLIKIENIDVNKIASNLKNVKVNVTLDFNIKTNTITNLKVVANGVKALLEEGLSIVDENITEPIEYSAEKIEISSEDKYAKVLLPLAKGQFATFFAMEKAGVKESPTTISFKEIGGLVSMLLEDFGDVEVTTGVTITNLIKKFLGTTDVLSKINNTNGVMTSKIDKDLITEMNYAGDFSLQFSKNDLKKVIDYLPEIIPGFPSGISGIAMGFIKEPVDGSILAGKISYTGSYTIK